MCCAALMHTRIDECASRAQRYKKGSRPRQHATAAAQPIGASHLVIRNADGTTSDYRGD
jgi:hypothetical protein